MDLPEKERVMFSLLRLCTIFVLSAPVLVHAQGTLDRGSLENPGNGKHYSGIGVISGWHCLEGRLTVSFNGSEQIPLTYGSERLDTKDVCGGFEDTGFGSIFNWALLGAGTHTAVAYHDGVEFARSTFTAGTTAAGEEFLRGVSARTSVPDFPRDGQTTELEWNEGTQHFEIVSGPPAQAPASPAASRATLENPGNGQNYSGIGIISGWKCSAVDLTARVDGGPLFSVLYGNLREDTRSVCGDADNGFIVPSWNWGILGAGTHTIVLYDQGVEFARSTFTVGTTGEEFLTGVSKRITVEGFPYPLDQTDFAWNENTQHFEMIGGLVDDGDEPGGPSFGTATIADQRYTQNTAISSLTLPAAGGGTAPLTYSLSPALPAGLRFNQVTRELNGTPTSSLSPTPYTYTVTDATGATATLIFSLTVSASTLPVSFGGATIADQRYTQNTAITPLTLPAATGGTAPLTYSLSPALPAALLFYPSTRVLSGTPTSPQPATPYTYTVTDATGTTASLTFNLSVEGTLPTLTNSLGMEFVLIPAGTFQMGSPTTEPGRDSDETLHTVTLSQPFYLSKHEVTQAQWQAIMGSNPSQFPCDACPVESVTWNEVQAFIEELDLQEGVQVYRLPTEAEWEYAARAGTQTVYHFGNAEGRLELYGWCGYIPGVRGAYPVGQKRPNGWGLYDMHGNVWEWVQDWYGDYPSGAVTDPQGPSSGNLRVERGGGRNTVGSCRAAERERGHPNNRSTWRGFRLARTP